MRWEQAFFTYVVLFGLGFAVDASSTNDDSWESLFCVGQTAESQARYDQAEHSLRRALSVAERFGSADPRHAKTLHALAWILHLQGKNVEAKGLCERGLASQEKILGSNHPDLSPGLATLAAIVGAEGDYAKSQGYLERALAIVEKAFGNDDPRYASILAALAHTDLRLSRFKKAEKRLQRVLTIHEKTIGPAAAEIGYDLATLAEAELHLHKLTQANEHFRRSLSIFKAKLGTDHPRVERSLNGLVSVLIQQKDFKQAKPLALEAIAISQKHQDKNPHAYLAEDLDNLAAIEFHDGNLTNAEVLYRRALSICESRINHPNLYIETLLIKLSDVLRREGKGDEAKQFESRIQDIRRERKAER